MELLILLVVLCAVSSTFASVIKVDVNLLPRVVFTGDSQTCGREGAMDYPQMIAREMPVRVFNTAVGGTNLRHLLEETSGGTASVKKGEKAVKGTKVGWHAGPYPGQKIRLGAREYTIDRVETVSYKDQLATIWITEPAKEDFEGTDYAIEAGWRVRVAGRKPDYVCFMYSVNDVGWTSEQFQGKLEEVVGRCHELGAKPIFLSGVPFMDAAKGGSHPGDNERVAIRANDLCDFCAIQKIPFGDVFHNLMLLDEQCTSVWADTVHPTTDGSTSIMTAVRSLFADLGIAGNPFYVKGFRSPHGLVCPDAPLLPFTTSQPDYSMRNVLDENHFDLAAIRQRDEYGPIATADGDCVESEIPIVLKFGVGQAEDIKFARLELVVGSDALVSCYDWNADKWRDVGRGNGSLSLPVPPKTFQNAVHENALWIAVSGAPKVALDYAALTIEGPLSPYKPGHTNVPIVWPKPGEIEWRDDSANLIRNGDLVAATGDQPEHWSKVGAQALYLRPGVVARGTGEFTTDKQADLFKSEGQQFLSTVRPLDVLNILDGPEGATGRFLISKVADDGTLRVRRFPKSPARGLTFEITRSSGCAAVPGGCLIQCRGDSGWQTEVKNLKAGPYRLGFFYRAFDPGHMNASSVPGKAAEVRVFVARNRILARAADLQVSYQWQRGWLNFERLTGGSVSIRAIAATDTPVEFTGFTLVRVPSQKWR